MPVSSIYMRFGFQSLSKLSRDLLLAESVRIACACGPGEGFSTPGKPEKDRRKRRQTGVGG